MSEFMTNAQGHQVPVNLVKPQERLEDDVVRALIAQASYHSGLLKGFKIKSFEEVETFMTLLAEQHGIARGGKKGNVTLTSFDGLSKVILSHQEFIDFGPELQIAKELIDSCIRDWSQGASDNIRVMVDHAFRVDKNNRLNTQAILSLRRLNIQDKNWKKAMDAIGDSMRVRDTRSYVRFYTRPNTDAEWKAISLDIAGA